MFYEEKLINGRIWCRFAPDGEWHPVTIEALTRRVIEGESAARRWHSAANPYATPEALSEALAQRPEERKTWEPCGKDDERFKRSAFVLGDAKYISTVRSNGDTYDHFVAEAPEFMNSGGVSK